MGIWPRGSTRWAASLQGIRRSIRIGSASPPRSWPRFRRPVLRVGVPGATLAEALPNLQATYCGTIAYEVEHVSDHG